MAWHGNPWYFLASISPHRRQLVTPCRLPCFRGVQAADTARRRGLRRIPSCTSGRGHFHGFHHFNGGECLSPPRPRRRLPPFPRFQRGSVCIRRKAAGESSTNSPNSPRGCTRAASPGGETPPPPCQTSFPLFRWHLFPSPASLPHAHRDPVPRRPAG